MTMPSQPLNPSNDRPVSDAPAAMTSYIPLLLLGSGLAATLLIYRDVFQWLWGMWSSNDDYSHGFLVPLVSVFILWTRWESLAAARQKPDNRWSMVLGVAALLLGLAVRLLGIFTSILTLEGLSLIPFLFGIIAISIGWSVAKWSAPALLYLVFMIPLPGFIGGNLSGELQSLATTISVFSLQTLGLPAVAEGNIIHLTQGTIGVAEACSGIRMLYAFFALTVGTCLIIQRSWVETLLIVASGFPIAIAVNCLRITATGLAYEFADPETAEHIFHDLAGWLMMPVAFLMLLAVLEILDRVIVTDE